MRAASCAPSRPLLPAGYYVNNEYVNEELKENPPEVPDIAQLCRTVLADHPRVTRFPIAFDEAPADPVLDPSLLAGMAGAGGYGGMDADVSEAAGGAHAAYAAQAGMGMGYDGAGGMMGDQADDDDMMMGGADATAGGGYGMGGMGMGPNAGFSFASVQPISQSMAM